jgi:hypothetical protein
MYLISVLVGRSQPIVWSLMFRDENNAIAALGRLREVGDVDVADEFGQRLCAKGGDLGPILFENMEVSRAAAIERTVNEQKIRAGCVTRMQSDPALKIATMSGGAPMLSPAGFNGRG